MTKIIVTGFFILGIIISSPCSFAQIRSPQTPQMEGFEPININQQSQRNNNNQYYSPSSSPADEIVRQQNKPLGYPSTPTEEQIRKGTYYSDLAQAREKNRRELYAVINAVDNESKPIDPKKLEELEKIKKKLRLADTASIEFKAYRKCYNSAYTEITKMLSGKTPLNLKRAVFVTENAFYKNTLSYDKYCRRIDSLVYVCKQVLQANGLSPNNYMACHYAIQKLFSEKVSYKDVTGKEQIFNPLIYDLGIYDKERDEADWTEQFVTKLLKIKMGQCHSMPLLYLILASELNANAYLALAPNHSYIKFGNQYQSYGFETTNGTFTSDEWIVSSGYVSATAIKNQIFLAPLSKKEVIAECLGDLADGLEFLCGKSDFSIKCAETTLNYYPKSIGSIITINNMFVAQCANTANKYHFPKYEDYYKYPDLKKQFDEMVEFEMEVEATGYQRIPDEQYERWRQSANEEKERREHLKQLEKLTENANQK